MIPLQLYCSYYLSVGLVFYFSLVFFLNLFASMFLRITLLYLKFWSNFSVSGWFSKRKCFFIRIFEKFFPYMISRPSFHTCFSLRLGIDNKFSMSNFLFFPPLYNVKKMSCIFHIHVFFTYFLTDLYSFVCSHSPSFFLSYSLIFIMTYFEFIFLSRLNLTQNKAFNRLPFLMSIDEV